MEGKSAKVRKGNKKRANWGENTNQRWFIFFSNIIIRITKWLLLLIIKNYEIVVGAGVLVAEAAPAAAAHGALRPRGRRLRHRVCGRLSEAARERAPRPGGRPLSHLEVRGGWCRDARLAGESGGALLEHTPPRHPRSIVLEIVRLVFYVNEQI